MKKHTQTNTARQAGITVGMLSRILNPEDIARPSWRLAKKLGVLTGTDPVLWVEKETEKIRPLFGLK